MDGAACEWEKGRECIVLFFIPSPLKEKEPSGKKGQSLFQLSVQTTHKPLSSQSEMSFPFEWQTQRWNFLGQTGKTGVPESSTLHPSQQCALMAGRKLTAFVWESSPRLTAGWSSPLSCVTSVRWSARIISFFIVIILRWSSRRRQYESSQ